MKSNIMKWFRAVCAVALIGILLLSGCTASPDQQEGINPTEPTQSTQAPVSTENTLSTEPEQTIAPTQPDEDMTDASLISFRQAMVETPQLFAVAYLGYGTQEPSDPFRLMQETAPELCENLPFLLGIPKENVIGTSGELYCIVPADENATVAVNAGAWNEEEGVFEYNEVLYRSESGAPVLLLCNNTGWDPDTQVVITDSTGTVVTWHSLRDSNGKLIPEFNENGEIMFLDFSPYDTQESTQIDFLAMVGAWELKWTEVEGDRVEIVSSTCTLQIETDGTGFFWISYQDTRFPDTDFKDKELLISTGELYSGCGNDQWFATVYQTSEDPIGHAVTLLADDTLLMQHSWEMDGMPMVSHGWYQRVTE